ncbi:MAG TPA: hypothetical protein VF359_11720 [Anaerolineales bacterium]
MKRFLFFILPCIFVACAAPPVPVTKTPTESAFERTKLFAITAEAETQISGYPANDATITAIMANKYAQGTEMAATMTAQPTPSLTPTIPPESPSCRPVDLKTSFASNGATGSILLGAGLINISSTPCYLQAWPKVLLVDRQGKPLDVDYNYFDINAGDSSTAATEQAQESATAKIGLWPKWEAWISFVWGNWCGAPVSGGVVIHLTLSNNAGVVDIPTDINAGGACNAPGYRSSVGISKMESAIPPP